MLAGDRTVDHNTDSTIGVPKRSGFSQYYHNLYSKRLSMTKSKFRKEEKKISRAVSQ